MHFQEKEVVAIPRRIPYFPCAGRGGREVLRHLVFVVVPGLSLLLSPTQPNLARPVIVALFQIACKIPDRVDL